MAGRAVESRGCGLHPIAICTQPPPGGFFVPSTRRAQSSPRHACGLNPPDSLRPCNCARDRPRRSAAGLSDKGLGVGGTCESLRAGGF